ncbi:MAG: hypothetical protein IJX20_04765 [Alphaproteobacteria bacterium]|nr:hypothetical protein [Alphaproteobacteria bacterium]
MKLYHYAKKENTIMQDGLLSFSKSNFFNINDYNKRITGLKTKDDVVVWMESCFVGRSRGIRFFTEPIKWHDKTIETLKNFVDNRYLYSIDLEKIEKDGLIEAVYVSPPLYEHPDYSENDFHFRWGRDEIYIKLNSTQDIDFSPVDWTACDDKLGHRFAFVRYYLLIIKDGIIPPKYVNKEN